MNENNQSGKKPKYDRVILKLSGEVLRNTKDGEPIDTTILRTICEEVKKVADIGVEVTLDSATPKMRLSCSNAGFC